MIDADKALEKLLEGNKRFVNDKSLHPNRCQEARLRMIDGQKPFAVIISCSDSRVPTEIIFDAGLGDLFVIRSAGHSIATATLGSVEYAVEYLGVKLIMILGHDDCGAIQAATCNNHIETLPKNLKAIVKNFVPAVEAAKKDCVNEIDVVNTAVKYNVLNTIAELIIKAPVIAKQVEKNNIKIVGANYNFTNSEVEIFTC
ncbi:MAG: carbonic anhydrase [Candidatus Gastranaerophilaceae bacterium]|jgi:carbonic anhydrase